MRVWVPAALPTPPAAGAEQAQHGSPGQELRYLKRAKNSFLARRNLMSPGTWRS